MASDHNENLIKAAAEGAIVLTANRRLSRHLRERFDAYQVAQGLEVWPSAEILPLSAWLGQQWNEAMAAAAADGPQSPRHLLTESQACILWERIIAKGLGPRDLLQPSAAARLASQAWQLLKTWRLALPSDLAQSTAESAAFLGWQSAFEAACAEGGWRTGAELPQLVGNWLAEGVLAAPGRVMLAGFDDVTPLQEALLEAMAGAGTAITRVPMPEAPTRGVRVPCRDGEAEMETAARWARKLLEDDPTCTIGVVAPDLGGARSGLQRIFAGVLAPGSILPAAHSILPATAPLLPAASVLRGAPAALPFNISHGRALADFPLVREALFLLGLWRGPLPFEAITHLLLSPYLAAAEEERSARAMLDAYLRGHGEPERPLTAIIAAAQAPQHRDSPSPHHAPRLAALLENFRGLCSDLGGLRQAPSAWADAFSGLLGALGWPAGLRMGSEERQTWDKLQELFSALAGLDIVLPRVALGEALSQLGRLAQDTQFQPEGAPAPVQILGMLEAGGLEFDHLWVLGLHDEAWPRPPRPNPFLPAPWQREHRLPQSSAARETEYARRVTARLLGCAPHVVVSHALRDGEQELRHSRLISALPPAEAESLALSDLPSIWQVIQQSGTLEQISDACAPPLAAGSAAAGGTRLFQDQAACPFRAFATHRLHARPLETPSHGLDPRERGNIIHSVLERLWGRLESSVMLHALSPEELGVRVEEAVDTALAEFARRLPATLRGPFLELERERLNRLLSEILEKEKERAPFTVHGREVKSRLVMGGIEVNTRADRIDQLEDGRHVLIDYKTGKSSWKSWMGPRPDEPQLPLYCSSGELDIAAVAFAQLRRGETRFQGLETEAGILPQAVQFDTIPQPPGAPHPPTRQSVLDEWKSVLENLGEQFRQGAAQVDPKDARKTCEYCHLKPACRIHEANALARAEDGDQDAG